MGALELGEKLIVGTVVRGVVMSFLTVEIDVKVLTLISSGTSCWIAPVITLHETGDNKKYYLGVNIEDCSIES